MAGTAESTFSNRNTEQHPVQERTMKVPQLIENASFGPDALKVMGRAFDEAWQTIGGNFGDDPNKVEAARTKLATALLAVANDQSTDAEALKRAAIQIVARDIANL